MTATTDMTPSFTVWTDPTTTALAPVTTTTTTDIAGHPDFPSP
jgi:hypothetical protein